MTTDNHPITPPLDLVREWAIASPLQRSDEYWAYELYIAHHAARWGADQELEACCEWLRGSLPGYDKHYADCLHTARRPKPPSLKEQALAALDDAVMRGDCITISDSLPTIRRALEQLDD